MASPSVNQPALTISVLRDCGVHIMIHVPYSADKFALLERIDRCLTDLKDSLAAQGKAQ